MTVEFHLRGPDASHFDHGRALASAHRRTRRNANEMPGATLRALIRQPLPATVQKVVGRALADLLPGYSIGLTIVATSRKTRCSRIYDLAREFVAHSGGAFDPGALTTFVTGYQSVQLLQPAELMFLCSMLRVAMLERIAAGGAIAGIAIERPLPLHEIDAFDWRVFAAQAMAQNPVEAILRRERSGIYCGTELTCREIYWTAVQRLARRLRQPESSIAETAVTLADAGLERNVAEARESHVGQFLFGSGRERLERALVPTSTRPWHEGFRRHAAATYITAFVTMNAALVALALCNGYAPALSIAQLCLVIPLLALVLSQPVSDALRWLLTASLHPSQLPSYDFSAGIPESARSIAAVSVLVSRLQQIPEICARLERRFLGNRHTHLTFCLLMGFTDAPTETTADDGPLLEAAKNAIKALNEKFGSARHQPFALFYRARQWNPIESVWMGWERKRGKLAMFHRYLLGHTDEVFTCIAGDGEKLRGTKYVIALDADTGLPQGRASLLVGFAAHPQNHPRFDAQTRRVVEGFTIFQPAMGTAERDENDSNYAALFHSVGAAQFYPRILHRDVLQDAFGEGAFLGKGVYDVQAYEHATQGRFPDNLVLSHDVMDGNFARAAFIGNSMLPEEYPRGYYSDAMRLHRWVRGDWQNAPWLLPRVPAVAPDGTPTTERNPLSLAARFKIANSVRYCVLPAAQTLMLLMGWLVLPNPAYWTLIVLGCGVLPSIADMVHMFIVSGDEVRLAQRFRYAFLTLPLGIKHVIAAWVITPFHAFLYGDASTRSLWRMLVTRRRMLEWTPFSDVHSKDDLSTYVRLMWAVPTLVAVTTLALVLLRPAALMSAAFVLMLWFVSPLLVWLVSRPPQQDEAAVAQPPQSAN